MEECISLVSGFDWYRSANGTIYYPNPSGLVAGELNGTIVDNCVLRGVVLPVDFSSIKDLDCIIRNSKPRAVVGLGLHPLASEPLIELSSVNYGYYKVNSSAFSDYLHEDSPFAIPIQVDFLDLLAYLESEGYRVELSNTSGLYLCNAAAYTMYKYSLESGRPSVFLHVPPVGELRVRLGLTVNASWSADMLKELVLKIVSYLLRRG